jgi:excisionase family DNA binding protein
MGAVEREEMQAGEPQDDVLWTVDDVARYLRVSKSWVYQGVAAGRVPCIRVGALVRFDPVAFKAWAAGKLEPTAGKVVRLPGRRG